MLYASICNSAIRLAQPGIWGFGPTDGDAQDILLQSQAGSLFDSASDASRTLQAWTSSCPAGASPEARAAYTRMGLAKGLIG